MQSQPAGAQRGPWTSVGVSAHPTSHPAQQHQQLQQQPQVLPSPQPKGKSLAVQEATRPGAATAVAAPVVQAMPRLGCGVVLGQFHNGTQAQAGGVGLSARASQNPPRSVSPTRGGLRLAQQLPVTSLEVPPLIGGAELRDSGPPSPGSLCSTVTAGPARRHAGRPAGPEQQSDGAMMLRLEEGLARLTSRVDAALADLQADLARLREGAARDQASCTVRLDTLEQRLGAGEREHATCSSEVRSLERSLAAVRESCTAQAEAFERGLAREAEARSELEKALGKDMREQVAVESERVHATVMREMRERMDGQKLLRDEVQFQQQSLTRLTSRVDEAFVELREELPRLAQENASQKAEMDKMANLQASHLLRTEALEQSIAEEAGARCRSEKALSEDLRKLVTADTVRMRTQVAELQQQLEDLRAATDSSGVSIKSLQDRLDGVAQEVRGGLQTSSTELEELREDTVQQATKLQRRLAESEAEVRSALDSKVLEAEVGLRSWVDSAIVPRVASLEGALRPKVAERSHVVPITVTPMQAVQAPLIRPGLAPQPRPIAFRHA